MNENKLLFHDVYGRVNRIYASHNHTYGFEQPYEHFHAKYELNLVVSTTPTSVKTLGRIYSFDKPHIRLHKPFSFHIASVDEVYEYERYVIYFEAQNVEFASGIIDLHKLYSDDFTIAPLDGESLIVARSLAEALMRDVDINMQRFALAGLLALAARYKIVPSGTETDLAELNYISKVNEYIGRHYHERLTATELSKRFYVSEQKLSADFKSVMNETLHHYIVGVRISKAAGLIAQGKTPLEAAIECGFVDESHFAKTFKARLGITPRQFKKKLISENEFRD